MLELIFQGFIEWTYGLILECWEYFSTMLLNIMSMDFAYLKERMPVIEPIMQSMLAIGWALLIGNLVFQAVRGMTSGLGFEAEEPKLLFTRTFVFSFLLLASPQICELCLNMTSRVIEIMEMPDAVDVQFADEASFGGMAVSWLLVIVFGVIVMFQSLKLILEAAERYFILAVLTITAPLAFGVGGSRSTSDIFSGWCRMYGSMCLLTVLNVVFVKNAAVRPLLLPQRIGRAALDGAGGHGGKGGSESGYHSRPDRTQSRAYRRQDGPFPRLHGLHGGQNGRQQRPAQPRKRKRLCKHSQESGNAAARLPRLRQRRTPHLADGGRPVQHTDQQRPSGEHGTGRRPPEQRQRELFRRVCQQYAGEHKRRASGHSLHRLCASHIRAARRQAYPQPRPASGSHAGSRDQRNAGLPVHGGGRSSGFRHSWSGRPRPGRNRGRLSRSSRYRQPLPLQLCQQPAGQHLCPVL